jgi:hypothetical protein
MNQQSPNTEPELAQLAALTQMRELLNALFDAFERDIRAGEVESFDWGGEVTPEIVESASIGQWRTFKATGFMIASFYFKAVRKLGLPPKAAQ